MASNDQGDSAGDRQEGDVLPEGELVGYVALLVILLNFLV